MDREKIANGIVPRLKGAPGRVFSDGRARARRLPWRSAWARMVRMTGKEF